ncbi:MAG: hypothetical protein D6767_03510 [Candidatus Hydrogenedentota bacterium]|nr:MAG: hypothetical protein D6767_03510 [Candidatus Hydrogenedentota bacterium]
MKLRTEFLLAALLVPFFTFVFTWQYFTSSPATVYASSSLQNPRAFLFVKGNLRRYVYTRSFKRMIRQFRSNKKLAKFLDTPMGKDFLKSPPLASIAEITDLIGLLGDGAKWEILFQIFPAGMYYASSEIGSSFVAPLSRLGVKIFRPLIRKDVSGSLTIYRNMLIYSTWLEGQKKRLDAPQKVAKKIWLSAKNSDLILSFSGEKEKQPGYANISDALLGMLFPSKYISENEMVIRGTKSGVSITFVGNLTKDGDELLTKYANRPYRWPLFLSGKKFNVMVETKLPPNFWASWVGASLAVSTEKGVGLAAHKLIADYGFLFPEAFFYWGKNETWDEFFTSVFKVGNYSTYYDKQGAYVVKRVRYAYYRGKDYYLFEPHLKNLKSGYSLWGSLPTIFNAGYSLLNRPKRKDVIFKNFIKPPGVTVLKGYCQIGKFLKLSLPAFRKIEVVDNPAAYDDFLATLKKSMPYIENSYLRGQIVKHRNRMRGFAEWKFY